MHSSLSPQATAIIEQYLHFPIGNTTISIPYFNNKRTKVRGGLRVMIGKGSIQDITEEVEIVCLKHTIKKETLTPDEAKKMLIDASVGIDCSGFVYHVLNAESLAHNNGELKKKLRFPKTANIIRTLIRRWRTVENINVELLASDINSTPVLLTDISAGDLITLIDAGYVGTVDHIMLVESVERAGDLVLKIHLAHSFAWSSDGPIHHGVRRSEIHVTDISKPLLEQEWIEQGKSGKENETLKRAKEAKRVEIRRILNT